MSGSTSSSPTVQDVLKLWTSIPTRALIKRYQRTASVDKARASAVCTAYKQFIALKILSHDDDDALLAAPPVVHAFWREHVLDTAAYSENCRTLCGRILHHSPDVALDDEPQQLRRCQRTVLAYKKHFGGNEPKPVEVWDFARELPTLSSEEERAERGGGGSEDRMHGGGGGSRGTEPGKRSKIVSFPGSSDPSGAYARADALFEAASDCQRLRVWRYVAAPARDRV